MISDPPFAGFDGSHDVDREDTDDPGVHDSAAQQSPTSSSQRSLKEVLLSGYAEFRRKLVLRLGSPDRADDALHETFLRLERSPDPANVSNATAYVMRIALNLATDRNRSESRLLTAGELQDIFDIDDGKPGPEEIAGTDSELQLLVSAMQDLPQRRREILIASRISETPHKEIAARYSVSTRTIEIELKRALEHCASRVGRIAVQRFGPRLAHSSVNKNREENGKQ